MPAKKTKKSAGKAKDNSMKAVKVGAGVAAGVAAALAGAYLMYHKSAAPQRKKAKAWMIKVRKDAAREMNKLKHVSAAEYGRIIDKAMQRYGSLKDANATELMQAAQDLKGEWKHIQAEAAKAMKMSKVLKKPAVKKKSAAKRKAK